MPKILITEIIADTNNRAQIPTVSNRIVFAKNERKSNMYEFLGVYDTTNKPNERNHRRISERYPL